MTKTEYEIVNVYGRSEAVAEIQEMIDADWRPVGGISQDGAWFAQAMIRITDRAEQEET